MSKAKTPPIESGLGTLSSPGQAMPTEYLTDAAVVPSPETVPAIVPVQDKLADAWGAVEDNRKVANATYASRAVDGDGVSFAPLLFFHIALNHHSW